MAQALQDNARTPIIYTDNFLSKFETYRRSKSAERGGGLKGFRCRRAQTRVGHSRKGAWRRENTPRQHPTGPGEGHQSKRYSYLHRGGDVPLWLGGPGIFPLPHRKLRSRRRRRANSVPTGGTEHLQEAEEDCPAQSLLAQPSISKKWKKTVQLRPYRPKRASPKSGRRLSSSLPTCGTEHLQEEEDAPAQSL